MTVGVPISQEFSQAAANLFTAWNSFSLLAEESSSGKRDVPVPETLAASNDVRAALVALDGQFARLEQVVRNQDAPDAAAPADGK
jgi:hypothetical protein